MCPSINYLLCPFDLINLTASSSRVHDCHQTVICTLTLPVLYTGRIMQWFTENDQFCSQQHVYFDVKSIRLTFLLFILEWFSFECRKTKTKVITLTNHIGHREYIEPIKTRSNYMWLTQSAGKCMRARHNWLWFYF